MPTHCRFDAMLPLNIALYLCCFGVLTHVHTTQTKLEHEQNTRSPSTTSPIPDFMDALYHYITTKTVALTINSILIESANDTHTEREGERDRVATSFPFSVGNSILTRENINYEQRCRLWYFECLSFYWVKN